MLDGAVAAVSGASRGIGRATAGLFAREGACVVVGHRERLDAAQELVDEVGPKVAVAVGADPTEKGARELAARAAHDSSCRAQGEQYQSWPRRWKPLTCRPHCSPAVSEVSRAPASCKATSRTVGRG